MTNAVERSYSIRRGDYWEGETFRFLAPDGFDGSFFANPVVKCQLRNTASSPITKQFVLSPVVTTESGRGVLTVVLSLSPTDTKPIIPGPYVGDLEVACDSFDNVTLVTFTADVFADVTR